jgi:DNA-binding GntR family transcriptional regulator
MKEVRDDDPRAPYIQIADELKAAIQRGDLSPGQRLDSVKKLAERFGVAQMTASNAVGLLRADGWVVSSPGRGTYVGRDLPLGAPAEEGPTLGERVDALAREVADLRGRVAGLEAQGY